MRIIAMMLGCRAFCQFPLLAAVQFMPSVWYWCFAMAAFSFYNYTAKYSKTVPFFPKYFTLSGSILNELHRKIHNF